MTALSATAAVNEAIAAANSLPNLIANLHALNPELADQLESKPLLASRSPWGTLAAGVIAWASTRYGFGFDETTCSLVSGIAVLIGSYSMRAITKKPVAGIFVTPDVPATIPATAP
jgi:hypothetical protein